MRIPAIALAAAVGGALLVPAVPLAEEPPAAPQATVPEPAASPQPAAPAMKPAQPAMQAAQPAAVAPGKASVPKPPARLKPRAAAKARPVRAATAGGVTIKNFSFRPGRSSVGVGDTITWTNDDSAPHTATATGGSFDTGILKKGKSGSHTFTKAGTFSYVCSVHPNMKGTVVVSAAASNTGAAPSTATPAQPAQPARSAAAPTRDTLPNTGLNLLVVVLLAALFTGSGALLRRRVAG